MEFLIVVVMLEGIGWKKLKVYLKGVFWNTCKKKNNTVYRINDSFFMMQKTKLELKHPPPP